METVLTKDAEDLGGGGGGGGEAVEKWKRRAGLPLSKLRGAEGREGGGGLWVWEGSVMFPV